MPRSSVRDNLLSVGLKTIHRLGFNGCSVQDITEAAGVPKGSFYNHFESKEALGAEALDRYWRDGGVRALAVLRDETLSPRERLVRHFGALAADLATHDFAWGCLVGNLSLELANQSPLVRGHLASVFSDWTRAVETCLREAQRVGDLGGDLDAGVLAAFLVNAYEGAVLRTKVDQSAGPLDQFNDVLASLFA